MIRNLVQALNSKLRAIDLEDLSDFFAHSHAESLLTRLVNYSANTKHNRILEYHVEALRDLILLNDMLQDSLNESVLRMVTCQDAHDAQET